MDGKSVSIQVSGKVQNVGYRYQAKEAANRFGVRGFVKNQPDGTVYLEVIGTNLAVELFCEWCRKGPDWAKVKDIFICNLPDQDFADFVIK
ncbi:acylphosphatase [Labilibaculum sp. DW002]|uniref:acylphosphatase n=1 Tax=Paralabilibaculum antarcticum TaxID=2912572 RepID=A0ABT5VSV6_9BACT|nr:MULTISPECIES: acylphosphatase [unclassified Labilibaculum]MBI9056948.1 acylphosphatase [Labilibaculum sp.]MDE5418505.1 acylphosphatase [Labilibaculum sp. DW002]